MDSYLRGEDVDADTDPRQSPVRSPYRRLVGIVWAVGVVLLLLAPLAGAQGIAAVYLVTHVFLAGFVRTDVLALRRQGLDWGASRHLWFAAALVLPLVAPAYYLYAGRRIDAENERRGFGGEGVDGADADADDAAAPSDDIRGESEKDGVR